MRRAALDGIIVLIPGTRRNSSSIGEMCMNRPNPFSKRPTQELRAPVLVFLGEQDGATERMFKEKLREILEERKNVVTAYLARVHYGDPKNISVCLCMRVANAPDKPLVETIHSLFAQNFNRAVHLDMIFLKAEQEQQLATVCKPFYQHNRTALAPFNALAAWFRK
jgi:SseB protein C-terminal domain